MSALQGFLLFAAGLILGAAALAFHQAIENGLKFVDRLYTDTPQARLTRR